MDYYYRLIEYSEGEYIYAYSRKSSALDGRISYDRHSGETSLLKPCSLDGLSSHAGQQAKKAFYKLVSEGLPTAMHIIL